MNKLDTDIIIIGGGIAGLSLAALLGRAGVSVQLVDNHASPPLKDVKPSGRTVALMQSSLNIIKATGAWKKCESYAQAMKTMRIIDDSMAGREVIRAEFESRDIGLPEFGFNIPNNILRAALSETVSALKNIILHVPDTLKNYRADENSVMVTLESGKIITARLLVGADGRGSKVREIAGIDCKTHDYGQSAITYLINHSQSHNAASTEFHRPGGPLALVPLQGNQSAVVWIERTERAKEIIALRKQDFTDALQKATTSILGGITLEVGPECWPLSSLKAKKLTAKRMALMAEAAHVMSPITAQGLNLSLRDVAALAEIIVDHMRLGLDPGAPVALDQYTKRRRIDITTRVFGIDSMNRIVSNELGSIKDIRRIALRTVDSVEPLKKFAMQKGLAPRIDESRLARGQPL